MIAEHTSKLMATLAKDGVAMVALTDGIDAGRARSRIRNAARYLGIDITTHVMRWGEVTAVVAEADYRAKPGSPTQRLTREMYRWETLANRNIQVYYINNDDPDDYQSTVVGDWPDIAAAADELERKEWPRSRKMVRMLRNMGARYE